MFYFEVVFVSLGFFLFLFFCISIQILESVCQFLKKKKKRILQFWLGFHCNYRPLGGRTSMFTISNLPTHEHMSLFRSSNLLAKFHRSSCIRLAWIARFFSNYFIFLDAAINASLKFFIFQFFFASVWKYNCFLYTAFIFCNLVNLLVSSCCFLYIPYYFLHKKLYVEKWFYFFLSNSDIFYLSF